MLASKPTLFLALQIFSLLIGDTFAKPVSGNCKLKKRDDPTGPSESEFVAAVQGGNTTELTALGGADNNTPRTWLDVNDGKDGIGMSIYGTWAPGSFLNVFATSKFDFQAAQGFLFTRNTRNIVPGEAMINRVKDLHYNVKVTFVDLSTTNNLLAIYVDGLIDGKSFHKSVSVQAPVAGTLEAFRGVEAAVGKTPPTAGGVGNGTVSAYATT